MKEDIVLEIAKRTLTEVKEQVLSTPFIVSPFAFLGVIVSPLWATLVVALVAMAYIAYEEYKYYIEEVETAKFEVQNKADPIENEVKQKDSEKK
ncbi:hypothetical protein [Yersinia phage fHe-Yen9-04]|uniref:Uncharacterized protein n=1 Tax=Yersinia phage fHe-Yen9-04 TaxID=2052742 RepID=A0A2C9D0G1_9CAUD|nr:hypothetical protein FDJ41_gp378 [Yersinia phage fHe-Yen9-04]SOK58802.1 hypothetical protein [Yersinia phage fHe-Yen9-04]VUE36571.1 hypothetical protein [Yersinia phage fHe-Yen9-04]